MTPHEKIMHWLSLNPGSWTANEILLACGFVGGAHSAGRYLTELAAAGKLVSEKARRNKHDIYIYRMVPFCGDDAAQTILRSRPPAEITGARLIEVRPSEKSEYRHVNPWQRAGGAPC